MTEFRTEVVRIGEVKKLPNSDTLSITSANGYPVIVKTGDFTEGDLAVYVPVDALVPVAAEEFSFLDDGKGKTHARIRARKLRGTFSMGLLVKPRRFSWAEGDNVQAELKIEKFLPPAEQEPGEKNPAHAMTRKSKPNELRRSENLKIRLAMVFSTIALFFAFFAFKDGMYLASAIELMATVSFVSATVFDIRRQRKINFKPNVPVYDIEGLRRYSNIFKDGELVSITEKIHGCNGRFVHTGHKFYVGSRTMFRGRDGNVWDQVANKYGLEERLKAYPNLVLFGEVYGKVQDLNYGEKDSVRFVAFDLMDLKTRKYLDVDDFRMTCARLGLPTVPELYRGPWNPELAKLAEGSTTMPGASHVREGIVCRPLIERTSHGLGRTILKLAGEGYHLRKGG
jgi:hypothetical protein